MANRRRRGKIPPELHAELDERCRQTTRLLQERITYHRAKLAEERERKQRRLWRRYWSTET